jgi:hypothetical protein
MAGLMVALCVGAILAPREIGRPVLSLIAKHLSSSGVRDPYGIGFEKDTDPVSRSVESGL